MLPLSIFTIVIANKFQNLFICRVVSILGNTVHHQQRDSAKERIIISLLSFVILPLNVYLCIHIYCHAFINLNNHIMLKEI